MLVESFGVK